MDVQRGSSDRSGGIVLTMSSCLASSTFVICSNRIKNTTTRSARTYHFRRTRRSPAPSRPSVKRWPCQFWADCTINISEREFPTGTRPVGNAFQRLEAEGEENVVLDRNYAQAEHEFDADRGQGERRSPVGGRELRDRRNRDIGRLNELDPLARKIDDERIVVERLASEDDLVLVGGRAHPSEWPFDAGHHRRAGRRREFVGYAKPLTPDLLPQAQRQIDGRSWAWSWRLS